MGPEAKLYKKIKRNLTYISWIRLENNSLLGTPDLLVCNDSGHFFTIELKVCKGNKIRFSPHQISFHTRHPHNTFIMLEHLGSGTVKLFRGSRILELEACGLELEACCLGLDACYSFLSELGAWGLALVAWGLRPGPGARLSLHSVESLVLMAWSSLLRLRNSL